MYILVYHFKSLLLLFIPSCLIAITIPHEMCVYLPLESLNIMTQLDTLPHKRHILGKIDVNIKLLSHNRVALYNIKKIFIHSLLPCKLFSVKHIL